MNQEEQKLKVLKMLEEGTISRSEALDLLELIASETTSEKKQKDFSFEKDLTISIPELPFDFLGGNHQKFSVSADTKLEEIQGLKLVGKNSQISIRPHNSSKIEIVGRYKVVRNNEPMIHFENRNGFYSLDYNFHGLRYIGFDVRVPQEMINMIYVENSNGAIDVAGVISKELIVNTKNAPINITDSYSDKIDGATKNSPINAERVETKRIELITSNSKINVEEIKALAGSFYTSNAEITIQNSDIIKSNIQTKNARIFVDLLTLERTKEWINYIMEARTTNASIEVYLPDSWHLPFKLNASTRRGKIITEDPEFMILGQDRGYLHGETNDYEIGPLSLDLGLQTTNGHIKIKNRFPH